MPRTEEEKQAASDQVGRQPARVYEPEGWEDRIQRYYDEHPRSYYRVIQPIPV